MSDKNVKRKTAGWLAALLMGSAVVVAGCGDQKGNAAAPTPAGTPTPSAAASIAPPSPAATKNNNSVQAVAFESKEITLKPGETLKLGLKGVNAKEEGIALTPADLQAVQYTSDKPEVISVDAGGSVAAGPKGVTGASAVITADYKGSTTAVTVKIKYALEDTVEAVSGKHVVTNSADVAVVVNKKRALPDNYEPADLVEPKVDFSFSGKSEKRLLRKEAAQALEELFSLASKDGIKLYGVSGYRSRSTQTVIYNYNVKTQGQTETDKVSAKPGFSEHQTGLAIDVSSQSAKFALEEVFGSTKEGQWLAAHAHEAGFIIRYPKGKESITGYSYEPWHIRYIGKEIAREIYDNKWTLEEYFQDAVPVNG
ncbi:MAG: D-alanyl-D-alanine carboxypeptidase family protein [Paenibacillaceae bacterium]|jgi:D-alanyl-D-alanine carboxypeptidase|nr:D-alanyl-D-alanine carboxypeptidase family protein [Paenibacillaceae bacterium]